MPLPFLNPWMLAALPAVGIPVIIHLLNRHKSVTIEWGAMDLLRRVMVFRSRQIRLEDVLLMLVRCAAIGLVVLAAARPTTRLLSVVRRPDTAVLIALDGSMSMAHRPGLASRFDEAVSRAREILRTVEPGRPVTLAALADRPRVLLRNVGYDAARFEQALAGLKPFDEPLNLEQGLAELAPLLDELKAPRREFYLVTDGQAASFANLSGKARAALAALSSSAQAFVVAVSPAGEDNLAVTDFDLASGVLRTGAIARFQATVRNFGRSPADGGELSLVADDQVIDKRFVGRLDAGQVATVSLYAPLSRTGIVCMTARLADDALAADNSRYAVINVRGLLRVLCVDGDPTDPSDTAATALVLRALSPRLAGADPSEALPDVQRIPWTALGAATRLADYDAVVLVNVPDVPEDKAVALRKYVEQGGGLILLAGNHVKPETYNRRFLSSGGPGGSSLLPAELISLAGESGVATAREASFGPGAAAGEQVSGTPLDLDIPDHPLARPLRSLPDELLGEARFYRVMRVRPLPEARVVLRLAGGAGAETGRPILLDRPVGRGRVLLWCSGADRTWNNLAINPAFPILLQQAVTWLARQAYETSVTIPEPISLPLTGLGSLAVGTEVALTDPAGAALGGRTVLRGGDLLVESDPTTTPGFYTLQPGRADGALPAGLDRAVSPSPSQGEGRGEGQPGADPSSAFNPPPAPSLEGRRGHWGAGGIPSGVKVAANVRTAESDAKALSAEELAGALGDLPVGVLAGDRSLAAAVVRARTGRELWQLLLAAAVALLAVEAVLSRWYTRRGA